MERNLIGELRIMKELNIKPNMSALSIKYKKDRHTIKKYYDSSGVPERKKENSAACGINTLMKSQNCLIIPISPRRQFIYILSTSMISGEPITVSKVLLWPRD